MITDHEVVTAINRPIIEKLQEALLDAMAEVAMPDRKYAILDFPNHFNIGDSAIYVGETQLCRKYFRKEPELVTETFDDDIERIADLDPEVVLLLHGGGNFGDLYPRHQLFREKILDQFPRRKIVLLPQSIHYSDTSQISRTAKAINSHTDVTMMLRDHASCQIAKQHFDCKILLVPDSAFMIGPTTPLFEPELKFLALLRDDKESVIDREVEISGLPQPADLVDWPHDWRAKRRIDHWPRAVRALLPPWSQGQYPVTPAGFEVLARKRLKRGFQILSRGELIVSDRLHVHILATLLGKPHIVLDNSYGKVGSFIDAWTKGASLIQVSSFAEAVDRATKVLDLN